jgi:ribonuclease HI
LYRHKPLVRYTALAFADRAVRVQSAQGRQESDSPTDVVWSRFSELLSAFDGFSRIYTDGSKEETAVGAAAVTDSVVLVKRLPDHTSIFSAEARAILLALGATERSVIDRFLIISDSLSCLLAIKNQKLTNPLILELVSRVHELISSEKKLVFMWLHSHVGLGLGDNSAADAAAKAALGLAAGTVPVPFADFYASVNRYVKRKWQLAWNAIANCMQLSQLFTVQRPLNCLGDRIS